MSSSSNEEAGGTDDLANSNKRESEKQRRDQENQYLEELSQLISSSINELSAESEDSGDTNAGDLRAEKGSILKNTVEKLRSIRAQDTTQDGSNRGSLIPKQILGSLVMEALDGFMLIVEEGGRIEFASENVSEFLGIPQEKVLGDSIFRLIHMEDHARFTVNLDPKNWETGRPEATDSADKSMIFNVRFRLDGGTKTEPYEPNLKTEDFENMEVNAFLMDGADKLKNNENSALLCFARRIPANELYTHTAIEAFTTQVDLESWCVTTVDTSGLPDQYVEVIGPYCVGKKLTDLVHPQDAPLMELHLKILRCEGADISRVYRMLLPPPHYSVHVKTKSKVFKDELASGMKGCIMSTHNIVRENELDKADLPSLRSDYLSTSTAAPCFPPARTKLARGSEVVVCKSTSVWDRDNAGISLDRYLAECVSANLSPAGRAASGNRSSGGISPPILAPSIDSIIKSDEKEEKDSGLEMRSLRNLLSAQPRSLDLHPPGRPRSQDLAALNIVQITTPLLYKHRFSTTVLRQETSSSKTDLVRTSSSSSKASPSVRTSSRISPSPPTTSAGGLAPPPGGASTAPATAAAGFQVSSSSAANPAMSAFGGVSGRFSVASPTTAVGSSASAISRQLTPTFRPATSSPLSLAQSRSNKTPRAPLSPNVIGRVTAASSDFSPAAATTTTSAAATTAAAVKNEILSSLLSNNSNIRHTGPSARSPQATKTNELLKELLTAKENLAGRAAQTENISLRQLLSSKAQEKQNDSELLRRLNQPTKDPSSRSKLSELSKLLEARSAQKRTSHTDEGPPAKMAVPSLETLLRKDSTTPTSTGISPKWSEIPNKNLPRSEIVGRFRENRNNNNSPAAAATGGVANIESRLAGAAVTTNSGGGGGGILAAKLMSPLNSPQQPPQQSLQQPQQQQQSKTQQQPQQQQERTSPQDWPSELFDSLLDWPELDQVMDDADLLSTLDTVLNEDQAQISAIEQQLKQVEKSISSQQVNRQAVHGTPTSSSSNRFPRNLGESDLSVAANRSQFTAGGLQHSPGSPQVSPSLAGSGLVSPGHQMTGLASPGHQMTGLMRASPQNRSFLGTPQQKIIPPRAGGNMDDLMKGVPPNVTMKPALENTGMDGPVRHLSGDSSYMVTRSPLTVPPFPRGQRHASGDGVGQTAPGAQQRPHRHASGDQIQVGSGGLNPMFRRLSGDSSLMRQDSLPFQQRNAPLPVARKSSVGPPSSTVVSGGGGGLSPAAVGGPSTTGGGGMLSSSTTTPLGPVIGSTNLGTIGSTTIRSSVFIGGGGGGRSLEGPSGRSLNQEDLESFGLSVEVTRDEFFNKGGDLTSPLGGAGVKQSAASGGQLRDQFSPGPSQQGAFAGGQFKSGGVRQPYTPGSNGRFSPLSQGVRPQSLGGANPADANRQNLIRTGGGGGPPNLSPGAAVVRGPPPPTLRPNSSTLVRHMPVAGAVAAGKPQTVSGGLVRPTNGRLGRANSQELVLVTSSSTKSPGGLRSSQQPPDSSAYQPSRNNPVATAGGQRPDLGIATTLPQQQQLGRSTSLVRQPSAAGGATSSGSGMVQLRRTMSIPAMAPASSAANRGMNQQFSAAQTQGPSSLQFLEPNQTQVIQANQAGNIFPSQQQQQLQQLQRQQQQNNQAAAAAARQLQSGQSISSNPGPFSPNSLANQQQLQKQQQLQRQPSQLTLISTRQGGGGGGGLVRGQVIQQQPGGEGQVRGGLQQQLVQSPAGSQQQQVVQHLAGGGHQQLVQVPVGGQQQQQHIVLGESGGGAGGVVASNHQQRVILQQTGAGGGIQRRVVTSIPLQSGGSLTSASLNLHQTLSSPSTSSLQRTLSPSSSILLQQLSPSDLLDVSNNGSGGGGGADGQQQGVLSPSALLNNIQAS